MTTVASSCRSRSAAQVRARSKLASKALRSPMASLTVFIGMASSSTFLLPKKFVVVPAANTR